jgi:PIN domain nuclease of toxin-antitoxin system
LRGIVLDASAMLAVLREESGVEALTVELLADSAISAVNLAEVQTKLVRGDSLSLVFSL